MRIFEDQLIVITGGAGFIGSCLIRHLNDLGLTNILVVDELGSSEKWKNLVGKNFYHVIDKQHLFSWLNGRESSVEAIIHLGACTDTMQTDANYLLENNYQFSVNLAEYALTHEKRFIYASSAATYGGESKDFIDDQNEILKLQPLNMYGYSKQLFDQWAVNQGIFDKIVGLKFFNVFGPNENHKGRMASAIVKMVSQIQKHEKVKLFKSNDAIRFYDGEQKRDFIYVKDVVRMMHAFLENETGGIFNIGSGVASTWNELAQAVYLAFGKDVEIEYIDMPLELVNKYQNYSRADMRKTGRVLGEKATCMNLNDSVVDYVKNYLIPKKSW